MKNETILLLGNPAEPEVSKLRNLLPGASLVVGNSVQAFEEAAREARVLFLWSGPRELFEKAFGMCPKLLWVHARSAGLDKVLFPELADSAVTLTNGTGVFSAALGEFVLGAILYFAKDFRRMIRNQQAGAWQAFNVLPVAGQTVGIIGYGDIGKAVATRVRGLGMNVVAVRRQRVVPRGSATMVEETYPRERLLEMISRSDYLVVATPLTSETRGMIGEPEFAAMKPTAVVINVGRGPVIQEEALVRALSQGQINGAGLDVFDHEPLPQGHPFYKMENVLLSPHCADHTPDWLENAVVFFAEEYERFQKGEPLLNIVDKKRGY
ncbi:MAG: D-2-hydroxyacid dehydrogenase [Candidatus Acidiferrum sp.]